MQDPARAARKRTTRCLHEIAESLLGRGPFRQTFGTVDERVVMRLNAAKIAQTTLKKPDAAQSAAGLRDGATDESGSASSNLPSRVLLPES